MSKFNKSPLNYIGGKYKILDQLLKYFPSEINTFVDLFTGGGSVFLNVKANKIVANDNLTYLIDMFIYFQNNSKEKILGEINSIIEKYDLSLTNQEGYLELRKSYNNKKHPILLFVLTAYSFNHQIRFNNNHEFNTPFGKNRSRFNKNMETNLNKMIDIIQGQNIVFVNKDFKDIDINLLNEKDFVYMDPPYLITTGTYNDGKRGFDGWSKKEELDLLEYMDNLNKSRIKFALSNVLTHKGRQNTHLLEWLEKNNYIVIPINNNYNNSNYHTIIEADDKTREVLVINYEVNFSHDEYKIRKGNDNNYEIYWQQRKFD